MLVDSVEAFHSFLEECPIPEPLLHFKHLARFVSQEDPKLLEYWQNKALSCKNASDISAIFEECPTSLLGEITYPEIPAEGFGGLTFQEY